METLLQDLKYAARTLHRNRGFAAAAILTLALGIGANTAIFSVINGVLLRPLPYERDEELVVLRQQQPLAGIDNLPFAVQEVEDYRSRNHTLSGLVEYHTMWFNLLGRGEPQRVQTGVVSSEFFDLLGVRPALGRTFRPDEDDLGAEPVLVLSDGYWRKAFNADPNVIGRTVEMNDRVHTIVGVLPPVPQFPNENDVYMPTVACPFRASEAWRENRAIRALTVFARMKPDVTPERASADLEAIAAGIQEEHPEDYPKTQGYRAAAVALREELTSQARPTLLILLGTAGFVLLIACANVANLALARLIRREREITLRQALGAGRGRLARQLLTESTLVAVAGGVLGLVLATAGLDLLIAFAAKFTPRAAEIDVDWRVLAFTLGISVATGLAFGSLPALTTRANLVSGLKEGGRSTAGAGPMRARSLMIVSQLALSFTLLMGAGLAIRSLLKLQQVDPGFDPEDVLAVTIDLDWSKYASRQDGNQQTDGPKVLAFFNSVLERVRSYPGVSSVGLGSTFPLNQGGTFNGPFLIEGRPDEEGKPRLADFRVASPEYFQTLGIPLLQGRLFGASDDGEAPTVVVLNQSLARKYFGDEDPIGQRISSDAGQNWDLVVGVIGDVKQYGLDQAPGDEIYYPLQQAPVISTELLTRTSGDPEGLAKAIANAVHATDPDQPVANARTLERVKSESLATPRLTASLLALLAGLALAISATGIAGVIAFSVGQRTHEIGVRMALGAARQDVLGMVMRQGLVLAAIGVGVGVLGALALTQLMRGLLFEVAPTDPITYGAVSAVLVGVAALACFVPARRATAVSPLSALRSE